MNDIRRTILWVIFAFSLVMLWDQWQVYNGHKATFFPSASNVAARASAPASAAASATPPAASATAVPAATSTSAPPSGAPAAAALPRERIEVQTDVLKLVFDTEGGAIVKSEFLKYDETGQTNQPFVLLDTSANRVYQAQSGLIGGPFPTHKTPMKFSGERSLADGANELVLRFESPEQGGVRLIKTYTLKRGAYVIDVRHEVVNQSGQAINPQLYVQLVRDGNKPPGESSFYSTFTGPAFYTDAKKFQKVEFSDIEKNKAEFVTSSPDGWVAMVQHYFASAWLLPDGKPRENFARKIDQNLYAAGMITPIGAIAPGATAAVDARLFIGPQEEKVLESIAPGLELVKDYGFFTILSKPLYWLLDKLHGFIGNWGWSIVALVVLLKIAFYWFNAKAYQSMAKMKAINPKVMDMRERYKDNPQQMQQEMMRIYREEKVNPMGGCLPILIQIPVFIALYWVLLSSVEMRGAPWILWIKDLSVRDPYFILPIV
ncbi:MAG: membrane protein insertase YidC, partial [Ottowia sp.]|nr:membrane protein insertase YidC [Ottowia sp.]